MPPPTPAGTVVVNSLVARQLFMSESTVRTHVGKVYEKPGAHTRASAIMAAVRLGFVKSVDRSQSRP